MTANRLARNSTGGGRFSLRSLLLAISAVAFCCRFPDFVHNLIGASLWASALVPCLIFACLGFRSDKFARVDLACSLAVVSGAVYLATAYAFERIRTYNAGPAGSGPYGSDELFDKCLIFVFEAINHPSLDNVRPAPSVAIITYAMGYLVLLTSMSSGFTLGSVIRLIKAWHNKSKHGSGL
ncbi:MAG: hypothetical protein QGG36_19245 [Pirellulaceae bacterium]|jgi:hypothetical protein|nr:hypothetical protein [Pirellulaceae bacterium]